MCAASDASGCAAYDTDGITPLTGKGGSDSCDLTGENATAAFDGKCEPSETQTKIVMCQEAEPGQTVYWALKDSAVYNTSVVDFTSSFAYEVDGTTCNSPLIQCSGNTQLQCANPQNDMYEYTRVWSYEIPAKDGSACDLCGSGGSTEETPEWVWLACGRGKGNCGDTMDLQDLATSRHEVRCCASEKVADGWKTNGGACSSIWHESDLIGLDDSTGNCFHTATFEEATAICAKNNASLCKKQQIEDGCVKGEHYQCWISLSQRWHI